jgi:hypothetical protein
MGGAARAAAADYDQARVTDRLLVVYQELLARRSVAGGGLTCF